MGDSEREWVSPACESVGGGVASGDEFEILAIINEKTERERERVENTQIRSHVITII